jgi:hypothetical protein
MFEDRVYEIKEITYDRLELLDFYNSVKHLALDYSEIRERATDGLFSSVTLVGDEYMDEEFHDYPVIKKYMDMFNPVKQEIGSGNVALTIYQPGFQFHPHTDFSRKSVIMFPILPEDGGVGLDFYSEEILGENAHLVHTDEQAMAPGHDDEFFLGTCQYSTIHPTLMDTERVHGVRNDHRTRVYLQISMYDMFDDVVKMIKSGEFLNIKGES